MSNSPATTGSKTSGSILGNVGDVNIKFDTPSIITAGLTAIGVVIFGVIFSKIINKFF
jgi:hypothetical protein